METFANRLVRYRKQLAINRSELGRRAGISPTAVRDLEVRGFQPRLPVLVRLADALGLPLDELVGRNFKKKLKEHL